MNTTINWAVIWRLDGEYDSVREEFPDFEDALEQYKIMTTTHDVRHVDLQQVVVITHRSMRRA